MRAILPSWGVALPSMLLLLLLASAAPLLTYSLALALFGGAHVLAELRFVEARFSARLAARLLAGIGVLLAVVVGVRLLRAVGVLVSIEGIQIELAAVAGLGALCLPTLVGAGWGPLLLGGGLVALLSVGLLAAPMWTILALTALHNWTPAGFLAEGLPPAERPHAATLGLVAFVGVPLLIASGLPGTLLGAAWHDLSVLPTGSLAANLGAYLPAEWHPHEHAVALFSALVFAQCMHYIAVIGILPRVAPGGPQADAVVGLSRIPARTWAGGVVLLSLLGLVGYAIDFSGTRVWYGLIAAVHAWIEVPILLLALVPTLHAPAPPPAAR